MGRIVKAERTSSETLMCNADRASGERDHVGRRLGRFGKRDNGVQRGRVISLKVRRYASQLGHARSL